MLKNLKVRNFALISEASLNFAPGYTVITGETGSGKSILLSALNLLLGDRANIKVIGPNGDKAIVEATFMINQADFVAFFEENDLDAHAETIIRREISSQGRSRAFINDIPVQLTTLKEFTERLISIHSQYNTLELKRNDFQFHTLDVLASTAELYQSYHQKFLESKRLQKEIENQEEILFQLEKDKDYNEFQLKELEELNLEKNQFSTLEQQLLHMENAEEIHQITSSLSLGLSGDGAIIEQLQTLKSLAYKLSKFDASKVNLEERLKSAIIELKDIDEELQDTINSSESYDLAAKIQLSDLIDRYNRVLMKHKCTNEEELITLYHSLQASVSNNESLKEKIELMKADLKQMHQDLFKLADDLHQKRQQSIPEIEKRISTLLTELKLPDTRLEFKLEKQEDLLSTGIDRLSLLFSANKGIAPVKIENSASGGELSRVMLALQQLISEKTKLPTIFFDEIDTGVSGEVAQKIGLLLQQMGKTMQLFAISHLPQVAAKAQHHFKVKKSSSDNLVQTSIVELDEKERIEEIARLMSGEVINEAAISNAKALMQ